MPWTSVSAQAYWSGALLCMPCRQPVCLCSHDLNEVRHHLTGAHIDEESGRQRVQHHLRPGVDTRERHADAHA